MKENRNIEDFFKKRLENSDFSYQESDWVMLEQRLDAAAIPGSSAGWLTPVKLAVLGVVLVAITFIAGWFTHAYLTENEQQSTGDQDLVAVLYPQAEKAYPINIPEISMVGPVSKLSDTPDTGETLPEKASSVKSGQEAASDGNLVLLDTEEKTEPAPVSDQVGEAASIESWQVEPKSPDVQIPVSDREFHKKASAEPRPLYAEESSATENRSFWSRWSVGASLAPDFNSVGISNAKTASALLGGQLYFDLAKRWTLSSGVMINRKKYTADGAEYNPPSGWSYQGGSAPQEIDGSCKVIDIPVMISYQWTNLPRVNFSTAVGISNYVLLDEKYDFLYGGYGSSSGGGWSTEENSRVMWGVANVAIAVTFRLNDHFDFRLEPYVKKPLKEVGWGNIDLVSTGTLLTLRYKFDQ